MVAFSVCSLALSGFVGVDTGPFSTAPSETLGGAALVAMLWMSSTAAGRMEFSPSESGGERAGTTEEAGVVDSILLLIGSWGGRRAD